MNRAVAYLSLRTTSRLAVGWNNGAPLLARNVQPSAANTKPSFLTRAFSSAFGKYYHIEADNSERTDATKLTVRGPDVDGILASMTVSLAVNGCSLLELHAGHAMDCSHDHVVEDTYLIKDIFYVVNRDTGEPFPDEKLSDLAEALLEAAKSPMKAVSMSGAKSKVGDLESYLEEKGVVPESQITVIPSKSK